MNLELDSSGDLVIDKGVKFIRGNAAVAQLISNRLKTILGEWEINKTIGLPWFTDLLRHNPNMNLIYSWIMRIISETEGVIKVDVLQLVRTNDRKLHVGFKVETIYGPVTSNTEV
jgi:hypothetical protein